MKTEILVITDRSGSMATTAQDVIGGYNTFIREQREVHGQARVTFAQFDHAYEVVYAGKPVADVPTLDARTFVPRGNTALLDAIGRTLNEQGQRIAAESWADLVIVCILTDGGENASREYDIATIRTMTAQAEKIGWKFVYLGANQDSFAVAQGLGLKGAIVANYDANPAGTQQAYGATSATVRNLRGGPQPKP
jgi:Mg-chelatase subunit ChlD